MSLRGSPYPLSHQEPAQVNLKYYSETAVEAIFISDNYVYLREIRLNPRVTVAEICVLFRIEINHNVETENTR